MHTITPSSPEFIANPYPALAALRETAPVYYHPELRAWFITRYDDTRELLQDQRLSSNRLQPFFATLGEERRDALASIIQYLSKWMVFTDPPDHTRLRRLTASVFTVNAMQARAASINRRVDQLLTDLSGRTEFDFIAEFAGPLPALVIMDMLGVPEHDLARIKKLSDDVALFIGSSQITPQKYETAERATGEMADYFRDLITQRRRQPLDDALSALIRSVEQDPDGLSEDELVGTCIMMLFAGHETTTNHLANGLLAMITYPDQMQLLRSRAELCKPAIEELLRYDGPSLAQTRVAKQRVELRGEKIEPGDRLFLMLAAANRDPRAFDNPDQIDFMAERRAHLTFGWGMHICLGFPLARLEGQIALPRVLAQWKTIELGRTKPRWNDSLIFRGMSSLPIRVGD